MPETVSPIPNSSVRKHVCINTEHIECPHSQGVSPKRRTLLPICRCHVNKSVSSFLAALENWSTFNLDYHRPESESMTPPGAYPANLPID